MPRRSPPPALDSPVDDSRFNIELIEVEDGTPEVNEEDQGVRRRRRPFRDRPQPVEEVGEVRRFLGRTPFQWCQLVVIYTLFVAAVTSFNLASCLFYYGTLSSRRPYLFGENSILQSPGLTYRPLNAETSFETPIDWLTKNGFDPINDIQKTLERMQGRDSAIFNETCGPCSVASRFGTFSTRCKDTVTPPRPCVLLKLNRIFGFTPAGSIVEWNATDRATCAPSPTNMSVAKISCKVNGKEEGLRYVPQQGFPTKDYPFTSYKTPYVFLMFEDIVDKGVHEVHCQMDDDKIVVNNDSPTEYLGFTRFFVKFDSTPGQLPVQLDDSCCSCVDGNKLTTTPKPTTKTKTATTTALITTTTKVAPAPPAPAPPAPVHQNRVTVEDQSSNEGTVVVNYEGTTGLVCTNVFDQNAAGVVCKMLGYQADNAEVKTNNVYDHAKTPGRMVTSIGCVGTETSIFDCPDFKFETTDNQCGLAQAAGVECVLLSIY